MTGERVIRYTKTVGVPLPKEVYDWIESPKAENIRNVIMWLYKDFKEDYELVKELIK